MLLVHSEGNDVSYRFDDMLRDWVESRQGIEMNLVILKYEW